MKASANTEAPAGVGGWPPESGREVGLVGMSSVTIDIIDKHDWQRDRVFEYIENDVPYKKCIQMSSPSTRISAF